MEVTPKSDDTDLRLWRKKVINKSSIENPPPKSISNDQPKKGEGEGKTDGGWGGGKERKERRRERRNLVTGKGRKK